MVGSVGEVHHGQVGLVVWVVSSGLNTGTSEEFLLQLEMQGVLADSNGIAVYSIRMQRWA